MKFKCLSSISAALILVTSCIMSVANAGLILDTNGKILGATDILVDGQLYDVSFLDGTCVALFDGCDEDSDFFWSSRTEALSASQSLLDFVFVNGAQGLFNDEPGLTNGCSIGVATCQIYTPFNLVNGTITVASTDNISSRVAVNDSTSVSTQVDILRDTALEESVVFAKWSLAAISVPEPSTFAMFALGLMGLVSHRGKKQS